MKIGTNSYKLLLFTVIVILALGYAYWKYAIPAHRFSLKSELIMLGDFDDDNSWTLNDIEILNDFMETPFAFSDEVAIKADLNKNRLIDEEDIKILHSLVSAQGDPYEALRLAQISGNSFPRPRELYRFLSLAEYHPRPMWALPYKYAGGSALDWLEDFQISFVSPYVRELDYAIYTEAVRFDTAFRRRLPELTAEEIEYADIKLGLVRKLYESGDRYELLLSLIELVEDAETLTDRGQQDFLIKILAFRDHLRDILEAPLYEDFKAGRKNWLDVLNQVSVYAKSDLGMEYDFRDIKSVRNLTNLENYVQRAEWQYYKTSTADADFLSLINYAQHDPRYLRAVSRTSRRFSDISVTNHNLPMVLLFREALRIKGGNKKKAIGLIDETIRIPYGWIKSIPREKLPGSLALDNFLLPGNKEDGADKSRHWNVFGGISLYKSPQEALDLALRREFRDLKDSNYSEEGMREFMRDMIANLNGIYHVVTINDKLLY